MEHELKTWPKYFEPLASGDKTAELRRDDRPFKVGDTLRLLEFDPQRKRYTGCTLVFRVTSVLRRVPGLKAGYCLLGIKPARSGVNTQFFADLAWRSEREVLARRKKILAERRITEAV